MYALNEKQLEELNEMNSILNGVLTKNIGFGAQTSSRVLVISVGGMGLKTLRRLKREMKARVGNIDGAFIRFLSIDTDNRDRDTAVEEGILDETELPFLDNTNISTVLEGDPNYRPATVGNIIPEGFRESLSGQGANQVRLAGRLTLMDSTLFGKIYGAIKDAVTALGNFATSTLEVHVVAGLGGGSGSGMIVDVPYIVRAVMQDLGIQQNRLRLFGHLYLPNAYHGISNPNQASRNSYAALKEIDYLMNLENIGESFEADYPDTSIGNNGHFVSNKNIFDMCTLIGGAIAENIVIADPQEAALNACVEDLVTQCTSPKFNNGAASGTITDFFTDASFQANADAGLSTVFTFPQVMFPKHANYHYNMVGSASVKFPTEAIFDSFLGMMTAKAEAIMTAKRSELKEEDIDDFESGLIKPGDIIDAQVKAVESSLDDFINDPDNKWDRTVSKNQPYRVKMNKIVSAALEGFNKDDGLKKKIESDINDRARGIFTDPAKGPYYLEELITSNTKSGGRYGFYQRMGDYYKVTQGIRDNAIKAKADSEDRVTALKDKNGKVTRKGLDTYKEEMKTQCSLDFKIALCDKLQRTCYKDMSTRDGIAYDVKNIIDGNFLSRVDILRRIDQIVTANGVAASAKLDGEKTADRSSIFALTDPVFDDLKAKVRNAASDEMDELGDDAPKDYIGALTTDMFNNADEWRLTENCPVGRSKCAAAFRSFISGYGPFKGIVGRRMIDYFTAAYNTPAQVTSVITNLLTYIGSLAAPTCNVWDQHFDFNQVGPLRYSYLVLPAGFNTNGNTWGSGFSTSFIGTVANPHKNIYWSPDQDAIYCYNLYARMPVWIHKGLTEYERQYNAIQSPGVHINESEGLAPAWKDYPSLMIMSEWYRTEFVTPHYTYEPEEKMMKKVTEKVRYAIAHGIMKPDSHGVYHVHTVTDKPDPDTADGRKRIEAFLEANTVSDADASDGKLFDMMCGAFGSSTHMIHDGLDGFIADTEANAVILIRKQMKLWQKLLDEIDYYDGFLGIVKKTAADIAEKKTSRIRDFARYMLFGKIVEENKSWKYRLGGEQYTVTSKAIVTNDGSLSHMKDHMEMAACDAFWKMENIGNHRALMEKQIMELLIAIGEREDDTDPKYAALTKRHAEMTDRFNAVLDGIREREDGGHELTDFEREVRTFYETALEKADEIMGSF